MRESGAAGGNEHFEKRWNKFSALVAFAHLDAVKQREVTSLALTLFAVGVDTEWIRIATFFVCGTSFKNSPASLTTLPNFFRMTNLLLISRFCANIRNPILTLDTPRFPNTLDIKWTLNTLVFIIYNNSHAKMYPHVLQKLYYEHSEIQMPIVH